MENKNSLPLVAEIAQSNGNSLVVADVVIWMVLDEAHVATLAVHPDYRQRGIGQRLLAAALLEAIKKGAHSTTLEVRANNLSAQALYNRFGYEIVGRRPRYYKDNFEDAVIMTRNNLNQEFKDWLQITAQRNSTSG
jgi:ribosomal-protein-alanine N-acetyltransferase